MKTIFESKTKLRQNCYKTSISWDLISSLISQFQGRLDPVERNINARLNKYYEGIIDTVQGKELSTIMKDEITLGIFQGIQQLFELYAQLKKREKDNAAIIKMDCGLLN